jgi:hypothetical protein
MRHVWVRLIVAIVVVGLVGSITLTAPAQAKGADPCPEPNDQFQQACLLEAGKEAPGFIFHGGDVDAYRVVPLYFGADVHLELVSAPHPYKVELADWNGKVIASSVDGILNATLGPPGAYYAFVWSPGGEASDDQPYHLAARFTNQPSFLPRVLVSHDFGGIADQQEDTQFASFRWASGRLTITSKEVPAVYNAPESLKVDGLRNFTWTFDSRRVNAATRAGYHAIIRDVIRVGNISDIAIFVGTDAGAFEIRKRQSIKTVALTEGRSPVVDTTGGVNRTTIYAADEDILLYVNGQQVAHLRDEQPVTGKISLSLIGHDQPPPSFHFDNFLVTAPGTP